MGLKVENVSKHFGDKLAVDNISFEINKPGAFGLLGTDCIDYCNIYFGRNRISR